MEVLSPTKPVASRVMFDHEDADAHDDAHVAYLRS